MGALEVSGLGFRFAGGAELLSDVAFRVGNGERAALIGANGAGKTTLVRLLAGDETGFAGTVAVDGRLGVMRQFIGALGGTTTVRDLPVSVAPPAVRAASAQLADAERAVESEPSSEAGMRVGEAWAAWAGAGGHEAEVLWDTCTTAALRCHLDEVADRPVTTLSGGEQKRLALEALLRGENDVLVLDEPDNYLDVPAKQWLEQALRASPKTILFVSHDRELLTRVATKVVTLEARGAWTHGGSFVTWHAAREARVARFDDEHRRWQEERRHLEAQVRELRRRSQVTDAFSSRLRATQTKVRRQEAAAPAERPREQTVAIRLEGGRTGKRAVMVEDLGLAGLVAPFSTEVIFGERVGVLGRNGTGKSHFLRLLAGDGDVRHSGDWTLGARVVPGHFSQTHDQPELAGRRLLEFLTAAGLALGAAMSALRRYELQEAASQPFETLSGGQQARLQILLLELAGANLLLLDEPTDNLDAASAEALGAAIETFNGTVLAVSHDRWFLRGFDRFLVFHRDGHVTEELTPVWS
ncbi:ATP-binding cassette domain-containing protein [soil metagenome]